MATADSTTHMKTNFNRTVSVSSNFQLANYQFCYTQFCLLKQIKQWDQSLIVHPVLTVLNGKIQGKN